MANLWYCFVKYHQSSLACITPASLISCIVLKRFCYGCNWAFTVHAHLKQIKLIWRLHYFSTIYHVASLEQRTQWHDPRALHSLLYVYIIVQGPQERVQILSSVAPHLGNLCWRTISATVCQVHCCNKYKITQALLHHHQYGAAATSSKEQETTSTVFALVQNSWHSWLSSCTELNVQRGHPIRQLTVAEREEHGPVIFLVATHRKFFIWNTIKKNYSYVSTEMSGDGWDTYWMDSV